MCQYHLNVDANVDYVLLHLQYGVHSIMSYIPEQFYQQIEEVTEQHGGGKFAKSLERSRRARQSHAVSWNQRGPFRQESNFL